MVDRNKSEVVAHSVNAAESFAPVVIPHPDTGELVGSGAVTMQSTGDSDLLVFELSKLAARLVTEVLAPMKDAAQLAFEKSTEGLRKEDLARLQPAHFPVNISRDQAGKRRRFM